MRREGGISQKLSKMIQKKTPAKRVGVYKTKED